MSRFIAEPDTEFDQQALVVELCDDPDRDDTIVGWATGPEALDGAQEAAGIINLTGHQPLPRERGPHRVHRKGRRRVLRSTPLYARPDLPQGHGSRTRRRHAGTPACSGRPPLMHLHDLARDVTLPASFSRPVGLGPGSERRRH